METFKPIQGITGKYISEYELILSGEPEALQKTREYLTLKNSAIEQEIARIYSGSVHQIRSREDEIKNLENEMMVECFTDVKDGLSVPPGFYYLAENLPSDKESKKKIEPQFLTKEEIKNEGISERYYQIAIVQKLLEVSRGTIQACTGSGKSLIIRILARSLKKAGYRVCIIVPSIELLKQTFYPLHEDGTFTVTMKGGGNQPTEGADVLVTTAQSAFSEIEKYQVIIFDEGHRAAAATWQNLCLDSLQTAKRVYALTASPFRPDGMTRLIHAFTGPILYKYLPFQAIKEGYLCPLVYVQKKIYVPIDTGKIRSPIKEYIALHSHPEYIKVVADIAEQALSKGRKVLVLFQSNECCKKLANKLGVQAASGEYRSPFYSFKAGNTNLCIANVALLGEGIDVKDISALLYCAGTASSIKVIQAFGRALRTAPNKKDAVIVDITPHHRKWVKKANKRAKIALDYDVNLNDV